MTKSPPAADDRKGSAIAVAVSLGVTQTIGYGSLYYAFGVLTPAMASDTGLSLTSIYGLFSLALVLAGSVAGRVGALLDRRHPAMIMSAGSLVGAVILFAWAAIPGKPAFALLLIAGQLVSVLVLYEAAFVAAAHLVEPPLVRRTITGITFIAGFASTIFWPLTQWLASAMDWRGVYLVYALLNLAICLPLHLMLWRQFAPVGHDIAPASVHRSRSQQSVQADKIVRRRMAVLLTAGFAATAFVISATHLHLIGLLGQIGLAGSAAMIGALIGPSQVAARVVEFASAQRISIHAASIGSALALPLALAVLLAGAPGVAPAVVFAVMFGAGQGLSYIVRGVLPLELFGRQGFGAFSGKINAVRLYVSAGAPFVIAWLFENGGPQAALAALIVAGSIGVLALGSVAVLARGAAAPD